MLFKSVTAMLLASSLAAAELEKKQYGYDDSYYSSLEDSLNSLYVTTSEACSNALFIQADQWV